MTQMNKRIVSKEYRVYGPPGTGKTTWIADVATRAAKKYGEDQVSLCSLTNTAIREVTGRALPVHADNVSTLHARCKRSLSAPAPAESRVKEFIKEYPQHSSTGGANPCLPKSLRRGEDTSEILLSGRGISLYERAQILRQQMVPTEAWPVQVKSWYSIWNRWCRSIGAMDFTGWLEATLEAHSLPPQQLVLVDEAQDHTPLQLAVLRDWDTKSIALVGDDDQNLYEWSGARPQEFFGEDIPEDREKVLDQSFRVPRTIHDLAMRWARRIGNRKDKVYKPRDASGSVSRINYSISDSKHDRGLPPGLLQEDGTYMILASCSYMLNDLINILKQERIPFHNQYRKSNLKWNPLSGPGAIIEDYLAAEDRDISAPWTGVEAQNWSSILKVREVFKSGMQGEFADRCGKAGSEFVSQKDLRDCMNESAVNRFLSQDLSALKDFRKKGRTGSWNYALDVYSKEGRDVKPRVIVGTIHSVKGGEADNVILLPDLSPMGYLSYTGSEADSVYRLFYVGITRARENLYLCQPDSPQAVAWIT